MRREAAAAARAEKAAAQLEETRRKEAEKLAAARAEVEGTKRQRKETAAKIANDRALASKLGLGDSFDLSNPDDVAALAKAVELELSPAKERFFGGGGEKSHDATPLEQGTGSGGSLLDGSWFRSSTSPEAATSTRSTSRDPTSKDGTTNGSSPGLHPGDDEMANLRAEFKAAEKKVSELRATGGKALQDAYAELKEIKPRYRKMQVEATRADRLADAELKQKLQKAGTPVMGSKASIVSARRLEAARRRAEARGGGMVF